MTTDDYYNDGIEIYSETFANDFDDVGWDPVEVDDSNQEAAEQFGY